MAGALGAAPVSHAAASVSITTANGATVCNGTNPGSLIEGSWSGSTCTVSGTLIVGSGATLEVGAGVTLSVSNTADNGLYNEGTIDNHGTVTGTGCTSDCLASGIGIDNYGTVNNTGTVTGTGVYGINNNGAIYNTGTMTGEGSGYNGIQNYGTIYNDGTMSASSGGVTGYYNHATIDNYCGVTLSGSYLGPSAVAISCYSVTFSQTGLPAGSTWGVTVSWIFGTTGYTETTGSASANVGGTVTYSYTSPVTAGGTAYGCKGCSGSFLVSGATDVSGTYSREAAPVPHNPPIPSSALPTTLHFYTLGGTAVTGTFAKLLGSGEAVYNVPGISQGTLDQEISNGDFALFPNPVSYCSTTAKGQQMIKVSGFDSVSWGNPGLTSTEFIFSGYHSYLTPATGWPSEPACS